MEATHAIRSGHANGAGADAKKPRAGGRSAVKTAVSAAGSFAKQEDVLKPRVGLTTDRLEQSEPGAAAKSDAKTGAPDAKAGAKADTKRDTKVIAAIDSKRESKIETKADVGKTDPAKAVDPGYEPKKAEGTCPECGGAKAAGGECESCGAGPAKAPVQRKVVKLAHPVQLSEDPAAPAAPPADAPADGDAPAGDAGDGEGESSIVEDLIPDAILNLVKGISSQISGVAPGIVSAAEGQVTGAQSQVEGDVVVVSEKARAETSAGTEGAQQAASGAQSTGQAAADGAEAAAAASKSRAAGMQAAGPAAAKTADPAYATGAKGAAPAPAAPAPGGAQEKGPGTVDPTSAQGGNMKPAPNIVRPAGDCDDAAIMRRLGVPEPGGIVDCGVREVGKAVAFAQDAAKAIGGAISDLAAEVDRQAQEIGIDVDQFRNDINQQIDSAKAAASEAIASAATEVAAIAETAVADAQAGWETLKTEAAGAIDGAIATATSEAQAMYAEAKSVAGEWWDRLGFITGPIESGIASIESAATEGKAMVDQVGEAISGAATTVQAEVSAVVSEAEVVFSETMATVEQAASEVATRVSSAAESAYAVAAEQAGAAKLMLSDQASKTAAEWAKAAEETAMEIRGEACAKLGEAAGPCADRFLPDPSKSGATAMFQEIATSGEIEVEIKGIPVKLGAGSKLRIERKGNNYVATITGEGTAAVVKEVSNKAAGGDAGVSSEGSVDGSLPAKLKGFMALKGGGGMPMGGVSSGDLEETKIPTGPTPENNLDLKASASGGTKCSGSLIFNFSVDPDKDKTCDGLGGLVAFTAAQGAAMTLPPPFSVMGGGVGAAMFADKLVGGSVTLSTGGSLSIGGNVGPVGGDAGVEVEQSAEMAWQQGEDGANEYSLTLSSGASATVSAALKKAFKVSGNVGCSSQISAKYNTKTDTVSAGLKSSLSASMSLTTAPSILSSFPSPVAELVQAALDAMPLVKDHADYDQSTLKIELSSSLDVAEPVTAAVEGEVAKGEGASAQSLWDKADQWIDSLTTSQTKNLSVTLAFVENVLTVKGGVKSKHGGAEGSASVKSGASYSLVNKTL